MKLSSRKKRLNKGYYFTPKWFIHPPRYVEQVTELHGCQRNQKSA